MSTDNLEGLTGVTVDAHTAVIVISQAQITEECPVRGVAGNANVVAGTADGSTGGNAISAKARMGAIASTSTTNVTFGDVKNVIMPLWATRARASSSAWDSCSSQGPPSSARRRTVLVVMTMTTRTRPRRFNLRRHDHEDAAKVV